MTDQKNNEIRKVPASAYGKEYFIERYKHTDEKMTENPGVFEHIYLQSASFIKLMPEDKVVDLGCGSGQMSILLNYKFGCDVTGIDYSKEAVEFCHQNVQKFYNRGGRLDKEKIKFICCDNKNLPQLKGIKAVFMLDFLEHLYPEEIDLVLEIIKKWGDNKISLVIRTDNKYYIKYIRPIGDLLSIYFAGASRKTIEKNKVIEFERHVNIMSARTMKKILARHGYQVVGVRYPEIDADIIKRQLYVLGKYKIFLYAALFFGKTFNFLLPSMYILAKYNKKK